MQFNRPSSGPSKSPVLFIFLGVIFTALGVFGFLTMRIDPSWTRINGNVSSYTTSRHDGEVRYHPNIVYQVGDKKYNVDSKIIHSSPPAIGSEVKLAHNPLRPSEAKEEVGHIKYLILLFPLVGIYMLISGFIYLFKPRKTAESNNDFHTYASPHTPATSYPSSTPASKPVTENIPPPLSSTIITPTTNISPEATISNHPSEPEQQR